MIGWSTLRGAARPLPSRHPTPEGLIKALANKRLALGQVGRRFQWPREHSALAPIGALHAELSDTDALTARLLADLLLNPLRSYVLSAAPLSQRYALIGAWEDDHLMWASITVHPEKPIHVELQPLPVDAPALADALQGIYDLIDLAHAPKSDPSRVSLDRALWIGGSDGESADPSWRLRIKAAFASRGLDVEIFERPGDGRLDSAVARIQRFNGRIRFIWEPRAGDQDRRRALKGAVQSPIEVLNEPDFEHALLQAVLKLDELDHDRTLALRGSEPDPDPAVTPLTDGPHYFKKIAARRGSAGDRMVLMDGPCNHNAWRRARKPDQAKRGIAGLAKASPTRLEHCDRCTGGGFWRAWFPAAPIDTPNSPDET